MIKLTDVQKNALHASKGIREIGYRYELLNNKNIKIDDLPVSSGKITFNSEAVIKRTASFDIRSIQLSDWLNKRIKAYFRLNVNGNWNEWPLGIFIPSTGGRTISISDIVSLECYDSSLIIQEDKLESRYFISTGTLYINAIQTLLNSAGIWKIKIPNTSAVIGMDKEFEAGTCKIEIINSLLNELNYTSIWVDENGYFCSDPFVVPTLRQVEYEYKADKKSVILTDGRSEETDLFGTPNRWVVTASNPEKAPLTASYTNANPTSKTSTISRGRVITYVEKLSDIADQATLDSYVERFAYEQSSKIYSTVKFNTPNMPHHTFQDGIWFEDSEMGIANKFIESSWEMDLNTGGKMSHKLRRVVDI